jgi:two-component system NarL family sensor kinase
MPACFTIYRCRVRTCTIAGFLLLLLVLPAPEWTKSLYAQEQLSLHTTIAATDAARINAMIKKANALLGSDPDSAIILLQEPWAQSLALKYAYGCGKVMGNMATAYRNKGALRKSLELYHRAVFYFKQQEQDRDFYIAATYNTMFGAYFPLGMLDSAALNCYKVLALYNDAGDRQINPPGFTVDPLIDALQFLGSCWHQLGYNDRSLSYLDQAEQRSRHSPGHYQLVSVLNNKSSAYLGLGQAARSLELSKEGIELALKNKDSMSVHTFRVNIAVALLQQGHTDSGIAILEHLLQETPGRRDMQELQITAAFVLGSAYYNTGDFHKAIRILVPALQQAASIGLRYNTIAPHSILAATYDTLGDHKTAYRELQIKETLEDSLTTQAAKVMNMMDMSLQTAERDKKISRNSLKLIHQQHKLDRQYVWILVISCGALLLAVLLFLLYRNNQYRRRRQEEQILLLGKEQEVLQLKALMQGEEQERARFARELHDGFVSQLSAIKMNFSVLDASCITPSQQQEHIDQLEETIRELRKTAHNLMPEILLNAGLCEAVQLYCDRVNQAHTLFIDFRTYGYLPALDSGFELPLYRMIQEAVQNIVKHSGATQAIIQFNYDNRILGITVEDNGCGILQNTSELQGTGLHNFKARVQGLNGQFHFTGTKDIGTTLYFEFELGPDQLKGNNNDHDTTGHS